MQFTPTIVIIIIITVYSKTTDTTAVRIIPIKAEETLIYPIFKTVKYLAMYLETNYAQRAALVIRKKNVKIAIKNTFSSRTKIPVTIVNNFTE